MRVDYFILKMLEKLEMAKLGIYVVKDNLDKNK